MRMVKMSAGSRGALRAQSPERWSALLGVGGRVVPALLLVAVVVALIGAPAKYRSDDGAKNLVG
jgi:hypothetical protein